MEVLGSANAAYSDSIPGVAFTVTVVSKLCGQYNFNIVAQGTDVQETSHVFPVTFSANSFVQPNYQLEINNSPQTAPVNTLATFNGTLTATDCYNSPVSLSCSSSGPPLCKPSPPIVTPTASGVPFAVTTSSKVAQTYNFDVVAVGTDTNATTYLFPVAFTSTGGTGSGFSFKITPTSSLQSLPAGQPAIYDLDVAPSGGQFPRNAVLAFSDNCPPLSTCTLSSTQVSKGSGDTHVTFTIRTTAPVLADAHSARALRPPIYALWLWLPGLMVAFDGLRRSRKLRKRFVFWLLALAVPVVWLEIACGGGLQGNGTGGNGQAGTPSGTYTMTVSATMSSFPQQTAEVELTVN